MSEKTLIESIERRLERAPDPTGEVGQLAGEPTTTHPVHVDVAPIAAPIARAVGASETRFGSGGELLTVRREPLAVISLVCGLTGIIPVLTQVIGLGTGIAGLVRIQRSRHRGVALAGTGMAISGIVCSVLVLLGWLGAAIAVSLVGQSIAGSGENLLGVLQNMP